MRTRFLLFTLVLAAPLVVDAQSPRRLRDVERFEVTGLPKTPASETEKEIFALMRVHKKGDFTDASRIHLKLAQYYRERGQEALEDLCNFRAMEAWAAASGERPSSAGSPGSPPFDSEGTFAQLFTATDELNVEHTWEFFADGTFSHALRMADKPDVVPPRERGFYTISNGKLRLWQFKPRSDRTLRFELFGENGKDGALLGDTKLAVIP